MKKKFDFMEGRRIGGVYTRIILVLVLRIWREASNDISMSHLIFSRKKNENFQKKCSIKISLNGSQLASYMQYSCHCTDSLQKWNLWVIFLKTELRYWKSIERVKKKQQKYHRSRHRMAQYRKKSCFITSKNECRDTIRLIWIVIEKKWRKTKKKIQTFGTLHWIWSKLNNHKI